MQLRQYQNEVKSRIYAQWESGVKNVLLQLPTGMGKTKTFCSIVIDRAVNVEKSSRLPTAIFVHRKELVQQISLTLAEEGIEHNIIAQKKTTLQIIAAQRQMFRKQFYNPNSHIHVISVDTWTARKDTIYKKLQEQIRFWIVDEAAHVLKDNKWGQAVIGLVNAQGLGVTATPERLDKRGLGSHVDGIFDVMVQGPSTRWGIENGFLSKYKIVIPKTNYQDFLGEAEDGHDYSQKAKENADENSTIVGDVVKEYQKWANGKQAIVFAATTNAAYKMERKFIEAGITAKTLTSDTDDKERLEALIDYRNKKIKVLINVDLFDEGLDVPGIECVIMARPTMSLGKYLQMVGRGLRVDPTGQKQYLILIDHVGNIGSRAKPKHGLPDSHRIWSLDRVRRRKRKVNLVRICPNETCNAPFDILLNQCPYCGYVDAPKTKGAGGAGRIPPAEVDGDLVMCDPETIRELQSKIELERPGDIAARVDRAGGSGIRAMQKQQERIETQKHLAAKIAEWAGIMKHQRGLSNRQINKLFWNNFEFTIWDALAMPAAEMLNIMEELDNLRG